MRKFALIVEYGTGKAVMLTDTPDIIKALEKFNKEREKAYPFSQYKDFSLPEINSCEILPVFYESIYEDKE